jgi:hypothetical protein
MENLERQYRMVEEETHPNLLSLYRELDRRWELQLERLEYRHR